MILEIVTMPLYYHVLGVRSVVLHKKIKINIEFKQNIFTQDFGDDNLKMCEIGYGVYVTDLSDPQTIEGNGIAFTLNKNKHPFYILCIKTKEGFLDFYSDSGFRVYGDYSLLERIYVMTKTARNIKHWLPP